MLKIYPTSYLKCLFNKCNGFLLKKQESEPTRKLGSSGKKKLRLRAALQLYKPQVKKKKFIM